MNKSLLFIPDISGYTKFVQSTEAEHSQHVISELLEVLIDANSLDLQLAEIEGDALFFYKEEDIPSREMLLAQVEKMFTAFYSHLKLLEKNRVCPCNACASAPELELKIIAHAGELQFISVRDSRKPFGSEVIEAHRLMKNQVNSDSYTLFTKQLASEIGLPEDYDSLLYSFKALTETYDDIDISYVYSLIEKDRLKLNPFAEAKKYIPNAEPQLTLRKEFPISAKKLAEYITNYKYRYKWVEGVDRFEYNENEVTRIGTEHTCVIDGKHLDFITVTKSAKPGQIVYGEFTTSPPPIDELYQFYIITPLTKEKCILELEVYWKIKSIIKKIVASFMLKKFFKKQINTSTDKLLAFVEESKAIDI